MPRLIALEEDPPGSRKLERRWEKDLTPQAPAILGRSDLSDLVANWEGHLSRRHARLTVAPGQLTVEVLPEATNPLTFRDGPHRGGSKFVVHPGERFAIGSTAFEFRDELATVALDGPTPTGSKTIRASDLDRVPFVDADKRLDALAEFYGTVRDATEEEEFEATALLVLARGIPNAEALALVKMPPRDVEAAEVTVVATRTRSETAAEFQPSRKLIVEAIHTRKDPVVHTWETGGSALSTPEIPGGLAEPQHSPFDWAFCVPVPYTTTARWGLYAAGRFPSTLAARSGAEAEKDDLLNRDMKFAGIVAKAFSSHRRVAYLQHRYDILGRFLSPQVRQALAKDEIGDILHHREADITVLFCDLRGSCRISEEGQDDLMGLWERISEALSIMTSSIIEQNGVIGDFQGDAAMGFWGWPLESTEQAAQAAQAALAIRRQFENVSTRAGHPLAGFACGVGIASGRAVAGKLGTPEQFKVSVYGPPVNLAARLESATKQLRVPILLDEAVAARLAGRAAFGTRRLGRFRLAGLPRVVTISELFQPAVMESLSDDERGDYDVAVDHFTGGRWPLARRKLESLRHDSASRFLLKFMDDHPSGPPKDWDGVIPLEAK